MKTEKITGFSHLIKRLDMVMILLSLFIFLSILILGVTVVTPGVLSANNSNVFARLNVTNTEPHLYSVTVDGAPIDLTAGEITIVNCTGKFWDYNGYGDIINVTATLYDSGGGFTHFSPLDNNYHYKNSSCLATCAEIPATNGMNGTCTCSFSVQYYANDSTWTCNMTIADANFSSSNTGSGIINPLVALNVPPEIDYGDLIVTQTSPTRQIDITNFGNRQINVTVRGFGGADEALYPGVSMMCELGNITLSAHRYSLSSSPVYDSMIGLTAIDTPVVNITIAQRTNDVAPTVGQDVNLTYWRIKVPYTVGGLCNGTIVFSAVDAE